MTNEQYKEKEQRTANKGLSAMLASEYILIDISLKGSRQVYPRLSIFDQQQYRAEVTRNISTAERPGR